MAQPRFITFEGGEGCGKSTQARRLKERLAEQGLKALLTREPGGSAGAEALRALLLEGSTDRWSPMSETLLLFAARRDHIERTIRPALETGTVVVCDRYIDSTRAYQGAAGGVDERFIDSLERAVLGPTLPTLTLILDIEPSIGLSRALHRGDAATRFEERDVGFHERLRQGFLTIARREPERCVVIPAADPVEAVSRRVWDAVRDRLQLGRSA